MKDKLKKANAKIGKSRSIKVKSISPSTDEPAKKRGRPKNSEIAIKPIIIDQAKNLDAVYVITDDQIDDILEGKRCKFGKLWYNLECKKKEEKFRVFDRENARKAIWEVDADCGIGYMKLLEYLKKNS